MNIRNRDFALLGYLLAVTKKAEEVTQDDKLRHRTKVLRKSCQTIVSNYPGGLLNKKEIKRINKMVKYIIEKTLYIGAMNTEKEVEKAVTALSMILAFIDEMLNNSKNKWYTETFANIMKKIVWLLEYLDSKYEHYECYVNGERLYNEMNKIF